MARKRVLDDSEAESGAAGLARAAAIDAIEALGEPRDMLRRDAEAGVLDAEKGTVVAVAPAERHLAAGRRVADGVADQVAEGAGELGLRADQIERRRAGDRDDMPAGGKRDCVGAQALE